MFKMANALLFRDEDDGIWYGDILRILDIDEQYGGQAVERIPKVYPPRVDPADILTDDVFKSHFRINKLTALHLADVLGLHAPENNRGSPLNAQHSLCICLNHFAGGHYQRVTALCGSQVSKSSAQRQIKRVRSKLLELKEKTTSGCQHCRSGKKLLSISWKSIIYPDLLTGSMECMRSTRSFRVAYPLVQDILLLSRSGHAKATLQSLS